MFGSERPVGTITRRHTFTFTRARLFTGALFRRLMGVGHNEGGLFRCRTFGARSARRFTARLLFHRIVRETLCGREKFAIVRNFLRVKEAARQLRSRQKTERANSAAGTDAEKRRGPSGGCRRGTTRRATSASLGLRRLRADNSSFLFENRSRRARVVCGSVAFDKVRFCFRIDR